MGNFAELHKLSRLCILSTATCITEHNMIIVHFVWTEIIGLVGFICWLFSVSWIFGRLRPKLATLWGIPEVDVKRIFCGFKHQGDWGALDPSWLKSLFCLEQFEAGAEARVNLNQFWLYGDLIFDVRSFQAPSSEKKVCMEAQGRVWTNNVCKWTHEIVLIFVFIAVSLCVQVCVQGVSVCVCG